MNFSTRATAYFELRAIDPALAYDVGVREVNGAIVWPTPDAEGRPNPRRRTLGDHSGPKVRGAAGRTVGVWWPLGRSKAKNSDTLICEGESDAMAAASILGQSNRTSVATGKASLGVLASELQNSAISVVALAFDGDIAGAETADRIATALVALGIGTRILAIPHGEDLASVLGGEDDPLGWLQLALVNARPVGMQTAALIAENNWLRRELGYTVSSWRSMQKEE